ncbi:hypothetical protein CVT91_05980 [Candidatus Atribacteria bacterium HGW-Atribacteria-1]|nr:MAG: hypothetical protein CVT91_05980 [Candidatus Atribacteria bacterium HGW-Atribacteria-1]
MAKKNQWVTIHPKDWAIKGEGNKRATKVTKTQKEAIDIAKKIAENQKSELYIQNREGKIRSKDSYGNDPCPPKDKEH